MSKTLLIFLRYYLVWIALFFLERLFFIIYFFSKIFPISIAEFFSIFLYGLRMDASMAAYICVLPLLFFIIQWIHPTFKMPAILFKVYSLAVLFLSALIMAVNLNIYQEWGSNLPYRAISTLIDFPYEAYISASSSPFLFPFLLFLITLIVGWFLLKKVLRLSMVSQRSKWYSKITLSLFVCGILFLLIRSGWQTTPLNPSMAYFSTKPILNHAAVNTEWNLLSDFIHSRDSDKNPFQKMEDRIAEKLIAPYLNSYSNPVSVLTQERPNVVLIILESFTADLIEGLGGEPGVAPNFEKLIQDGILFTNIYASSDRTDKGIIAIMSAFPSQATKSIIKNVNKLEKLPGIGNNFLENGYKTSYFHGGESAFYNVKSYMFSHGTQEVIDHNNFPLKDVLSKWGAHDHLVFEKQIDYLNASSQPFFSTLLTLSNHEPFDLPGAPKFGSKRLADLFKSTAFYTDSALFAYLNHAKQTEWYKNTLFVIIADHGHRLPLEKWDSEHPNRYRIPFLLYGDVIKQDFRGKKIDKIGGQTDLASTLLHQLNMDSRNFYWSKDLLDPKTPSFSFFTWNNGFGVVNSEQSLSFDNVGEKIIYLKDPDIKESTNRQLKSIGQGYLQETYRQYLNY